MDIFNNDAFSMIQLTDAVREMSYVPQLLASLGLFEPKGVYLRDIAIEKKRQCSQPYSNVAGRGSSTAAGQQQAEHAQFPLCASRRWFHHVRLGSCRHAGIRF